jgi:hypothetical protein
MNSINDLIEYIAASYNFSEEKYPALQNLSDEQKQDFAIRHLSFHFSKTAGKIAAVCEGVDHGKGYDLPELKKNIAKAFINTLRLAQLADMGESELLQAVKNSIEGPKDIPIIS